MICTKCGKEVSDGAKFCSGCGAELQAENTSGVVAKESEGNQIHSDVKHEFPTEVHVRGKNFGGTKWSGYAKADKVVTLSAAGCAGLGVVLFLLGAGGAVAFGIFLIFVSGIIELVWMKWNIFKKKLIKNQDIMYYEAQNSFVHNSKSSLEFARESISVADVKKIRLRHVKVGFLSSLFSVSDSGDYYVLSFDAVLPKNSVSVWFTEKENVDEFMPAIEYALKTNGKDLPVDSKSDLIQYDDFIKECKSLVF